MMTKMKRKKRGVALIFTMMVAVLAVAIATSYIGMTASSAKSARSYSKEALALSLAQTGLNATINAMGVNRNWGDNGFINIFNQAAGANLFINANPNNNGGLATNLNAINVNLVQDPALEAWFPNDFLVQRNHDAAGEFNLACFYRTGAIRLTEVNNGTQINRQAFLIIGVSPENATRDNIEGAFGNITRKNINYSVGVAALIFDDRNDIPADLNRAQAVPLLQSSRIIRVRVSSVFPGSMYQNMVAADYPGTGHQDEGHFGYPNWEDFTADAAFMDENTEWDGAMGIDGATNNTAGNTRDRWGAPQQDADFDRNKFVSSTINRNAVTNGNFSSSAYARGAQADTAGILKVSLLNNESGSIEERFKKDSPKIAKTASANQKIVYSDLANGTKTLLTDGSVAGKAIKEMCTSSVSPYAEDYATTDIGTIWNRGTNASLLSTTTNSGSPVDGLYRQMKANGVSGASGECPVNNVANNHGYINYTESSYKPDPMYANETMEVPTVRITIVAPGESVDGFSNPQNAQFDKYFVQRVQYVPSTTNPSGWTESLGTAYSLDNSKSGADGMLYVAGANIQVKGTASQSVSIVSDVNPTTESHNQTGTGVFRDELNSPNVDAGNNTYKYVDMKLQETCLTCNGNGRVNNAVCKTCGGSGKAYYYTIGANSNGNELISEVNLVDSNTNVVNENSKFRFPTYDISEQPSGNITVIGDLNTKAGTNPAVGLIAKNRVLLNDMSHSDTMSGNNYTPVPKDEVPATNKQDASRDGVLTVKALVASESHNMCFDFNNVSKNLNYSSTNNARTFINNNKSHAPGDTTGNLNGTTYSNSKTNYGLVLDKRLATKLKNVNTNSGSDDIISDDGKGNARYFYYKYAHMSDGAKKMIWGDAYMGAIRAETSTYTGQPRIYSNGTLNFHGMIISRFGDINADAGVRSVDGIHRENQLGYVNQFINFDSNLEDNCPPYFSTASQRYSQYNGSIKWNILSYADYGSLSWQDQNQN